MSDIIVYTPKPHNDLIESAIEGLRGELSDLSWKMYSKAIRDFLAFAADRDQSEYFVVGFSAYLKSLSDEGKSPATVQAKMSQLRRFFSWGVAVGWISAADYAAVKQVKAPRSSGGKAHIWLNQQQMQELLNAPDVTTLEGRRDKVLVALLMGCALRRSELTKLTWGHFSRQGDTWVIVNLSRKHHRTQAYVAVPNWVMKVIQEYGVRGTDNEYVLSSYLHGVARGSLSNDMVWRIVRKYGEALGFGTLCPHDLRRSWSRAARENGLELTQIQQMLGHESVETTQRYVAELMEVDKIARAVELEVE